jgi:hypothetical protein
LPQGAAKGRAVSFWSSLILARPAKPPIVTAAAIGALIQRLAETGALVGREEPLCQIKYGPRVDADERTTDVVDRDDSGIVGTVGEYPWDLSDSFPSLTALADALAANEKPVYRAFLNLGDWHSDIVAALTRKPSKENADELCLYGASFSVGPVLVRGLASETSAFAGWMGLSASGPGYFYPWEYREARERAEAVGLLREAAAVCRAIWPVPPAAVSDSVIAARRELRDLWLYDDLALSDWLWFASESG